MRRIILSSFVKFLESPFWQGAAAMVSGWVISFITPLWPMLLLMFFLVLSDAYSGVKAAQKRKEVINSKGLRRTVDKMALYSLAIMTAHGMSLVFMPSIELAWLPAFSICVAEIKSNSENILAYTGVDVGEKLLDILRSRNAKK